MLTPKVVCIEVFLKSELSTAWVWAPRFTSITSRMPERSDSSRRSEIPSSFFSRTRSAIFVIRPPSPPFFTMNGSSETMIDSRPPRIGSMCALARTRIEPRPDA